MAASMETLFLYLLRQKQFVSGNLTIAIKAQLQVHAQ
jgi:hypothetical protein